MKYPNLETKRLILRPWRPSDVMDLVEGLNDIEVSKWLAQVPNPYTESVAEAFIAACGDDSDRDTFHFAIELKSEKKIIGGTSLRIISRAHGTASGGLWLNAKYHGRGYGTEALKRRVEFAFNSLGLRRLESGFLDGNERSFNMQKKAGFKTEGIKREAFVCLADGLVKDEHITALLKSEWLKEISGKAKDSDGKTTQGREVISTLFENEKIRVEKIISNGTVSPPDFWYDNPLDEWVRVTDGNAVLQLENGEVTLIAGDSFYIEANARHRVKYTSQDCKWFCLHLKI